MSRVEPEAIRNKALADGVDSFLLWLERETDYGAWSPAVKSEVRTRLVISLVQALAVADGVTDGNRMEPDGVCEMDGQAAERALVASEIYQRLWVRTRELSMQAGTSAQSVCQVSREELEALEAVAPAWMRFVTADGDFTLDPVFGWRFRVTE